MTGLSRLCANVGTLVSAPREAHGRGFGDCHLMSDDFSDVDIQSG
jgi:hypothetical protein